MVSLPSLPEKFCGLGEKLGGGEFSNERSRPSSPLASCRLLFLPWEGGDPGASLLGSAFTFFTDGAAFSASIVFIMS